MSEGRVNGICKWFNDDKGFGFLVSPGISSDVFVHRQQLSRSGIDGLTENEKVSFVVNSGKKGLFATEISKE